MGFPLILFHPESVNTQPQNNYSASLKFLFWVVVLTGFLSLSLLFLRASSNISFSQPLQIATSGTEELPLFGVWKAIHREPIYTDPHKIPFFATYFNWLFFFCYGLTTKIFLKIFMLGDVWIPTITKLITLFGAFLGIFSAIKAFFFYFKPQKAPEKFFFVALAAYLFSGPLVGFWAMTTRPDIYAYWLELLAFYFFITNDSKKMFRACIFLIIFSYAAWAFKQVNAGVVGGILVFLLLKKNWKAFFGIAISLAILCTLTLYLGGANYRYDVFIAQSRTEFLPFSALQILNQFCLKFPPIILTGLSLIALMISNRKKYFFKRPHSKIVTIIFAVSFALSFITSAKQGAAENYYFVPSFFGLLLALDLFYFFLEFHFFEKWVLRFWIGCFLVSAFAIVLVLLGFRGLISLTPIHERQKVLQACSANLPGHVYVDDDYANLPWISQTQGPYFVLAYNYGSERHMKDSFERGGMKGVIEEGYFTSLVLLKDPNISRLDGALLENFTQKTNSDCPPDFGVFVKKNT